MTAFAVAEQVLCDFIVYCCEHHSYHARNLITSKRLLQRILALLKSTHAFLKLSRRACPVEAGVWMCHVRSTSI